MPGTMTRHHLTDRLADMVAVDLVAAAAAVVDGTLATSTNLQVRIRLTNNNLCVIALR